MTRSCIRHRRLQAAVYKHFDSKERRFFEIVTGTVSEASDPVHNDVLSLEDSGDVEADLGDLAHH